MRIRANATATGGQLQSHAASSVFDAVESERGWKAEWRVLHFGDFPQLFGSVVAVDFARGKRGVEKLHKALWM